MPSAVFMFIMACILQIMDLMNRNHLKCNESKTVFLINGAHTHLWQLTKLFKYDIRVGVTIIKARPLAHNIGAIFNCNLNLKDHMYVCAHHVTAGPCEEVPDKWCSCQLDTCICSFQTGPYEYFFSMELPNMYFKGLLKMWIMPVGLFLLTKHRNQPPLPPPNPHPVLQDQHWLPTEKHNTIQMSAHHIHVTCLFCSQLHRWSPADLIGLFAHWTCHYWRSQSLGQRPILIWWYGYAVGVPYPYISVMEQTFLWSETICGFRWI